MSRLLNIGTFVGGIAGAVSAAATVYGVLVTPPPQSGSDVADRLRDIAATSTERNLEFSSADREELEAAINELARQIAAPTDQTAAPKSFVTRQYVGIAEHKEHEPFDLIAPNGKTKYASGRDVLDNLVGLQIEGKRLGNFRPGDVIDLKFGDLDCRLQVVAAERATDTFAVRLKC